MRCTVGAYHVALRSLCCFYNDTDMPLEVALLEDSDSSYTMVPHASSASSYQSASSGFPRGGSSSSSARGLSGTSLGSHSSSSGAATPAGSIAKDTSEERLFEFERYMPFASPGWSAAHLLPADPKHWSQLPKGGHSSNEQPLVPLPQVGRCGCFVTVLTTTMMSLGCRHWVSFCYHWLCMSVPVWSVTSCWCAAPAYLAVA
jgi:hypothetical protein